MNIWLRIKLALRILFAPPDIIDVSIHTLGEDDNIDPPDIPDFYDEPRGEATWNVSSQALEELMKGNRND